jgi:hypothetical protein
MQPFVTPRRRLRCSTTVALLVLLAGPRAAAEPGAARTEPPGTVSVTSRVEVTPAGSAVRTRLQYDAAWGSAAAVAAVEPGAGRPLLVASGVELHQALIGPVRLAGAWRELARPLGHDASSRVFRERTALLPDTAIKPGRLRGVQLQPAPGVTAAGFVAPGSTRSAARRPPTVLTAVVAGEPLPGVQLEAYGAVRTAAEAPVSSRWLLAAPPFPGGELALAGTRISTELGAGELAGSVNVSLGPRLPAALHARLAVRAAMPYGELAAVVAAAGREFRGLAGEAADSPLAWAVRLTGSGGPPPLRVGYRLAARGAAAAPLLHAAGTGAADPPTMELAVTPAVRFGAARVSGEGAVVSSAAGAVPTLAIEARGQPGRVALRWRGARSADTWQVRAAAVAAPVTVEAGWRVAAEQLTSQLAVEVRLPRGRLRIAAAGLGDPPAKGPRLTVTVSVEP